jgi:uncharacterized protein (TIGR02145 family)
MNRIVCFGAVICLLSACTTQEKDTVKVESISLDVSELTLKEGESITLAATVLPIDAENKSVRWNSSDESKVIVSSAGKVLAVAIGEAVITASTIDGNIKAECVVTVISNLRPSETIGAEHISAVCAELKGKAYLETPVPPGVLCGFQYFKKSDSVSPTVHTLESTNLDAANFYSAIIVSLEPGTTYSYYSFVRLNDQEVFGETKEFTTKDISSLIETKEASDIEATNANLNAKLDLTDVYNNNISYGFYYGLSESVLDKIFQGGIIKDNALSSPLDGLSHQTQYWFKAYVNLDGQTLYGEVKSFTTDVVHVTGVSLDKDSITFDTIGSTQRFVATVLPADATDPSIEWSSDNEDVATVDANGNVTAKGNGTAIIKVVTKDQGKEAICVVTVAQQVTAISLDKTSLSLAEEGEQLLAVTISPSNAADKNLAWTSSNQGVVTVDNDGRATAKGVGRATITVSVRDNRSISASCTVVVFKRPEAVDLGLSVKWATLNLGASSPEKSGYYYSWGETEEKTVDYNWYQYQFRISGDTPSTLKFSKYNTKESYGFIDNRTVLETGPDGDDVASMKLGANWRIPTDAEWTELRENCSWTWTTQNGVKGRRITGKNGNSIFLPAAGAMQYSLGGTNLIDKDLTGYFWSSSLNPQTPYEAYYTWFRYKNMIYRSSKRRCDGLSVRPVSE